MLKRLLVLSSVAVAATATLAGCGSSDSEGPSAAADAVTCSYPAGAAAAKQVDAPATSAPATGTAPVTIATSAGDIALTLDRAEAPCTVNSFLSLAEQGYFNDTTCHRLTTSGIFVLQCGDPSGTSGGGPGYSFADELDGANALADGARGKVYAAGTVAMANAGPNTNGSQFFLVYADSPLPPNYAVFGTMSDAGLTTLTKVAEKGTANGAADGAPKDAVTISAVKTQS